jgi:hypothetical protein
MKKTISADEIIKGLSEGLGREGAQKIFNDALARTVVGKKAEYTREEALKICEVLKRKEGIVKILGMTLATQIMLME